jgi:hypothetical protein
MTAALDQAIETQSEILSHTAALVLNTGGHDALRVLLLEHLQTITVIAKREFGEDEWRKWLRAAAS